MILEATRVLLADPRLDSVLPSLLRIAREHIPADAHAVWRFYEERDRWAILASEGLSQEYVRQSLPAAKMQSEPIVVPDIAALPEVMQARRSEYEREGIRALVAAPLLLRKKIAGTLVFYFRKVHPVSAEELRTIITLSSLASVAIENAELYEQQEDQKRRSQFLADASQILSSTLNYEETLSSIAKVAVPSIADYCSVDILKEDGNLQRVAVQHADARKAELAREFSKNYRPHSASRIFQVMESGVSCFIPEVTESHLEQIPDPEQREKVRSLGIRSALLVPLSLRDRTLGVIAFLMADSGRHFAESDVGFLEDLARRAAAAVENARLFSALQLSQQRLEMSQAAAGAWSWELDIQTNRLSRSKPLEDIWSDVPSAVKLDSLEALLERIHPDDREKIRNTAATALKDKSREQEFEYRVVLPDGRVRWIYSRGRYVEREGKEAVAGIAMDISARREAEIAALANRARLQLAESAAKIAIWDRDLATGGISWSENSAEIYGRPIADLRHINDLFACIHPEDLVRVRSVQEQALRERSEYQVEFRAIWPDESTHWVLSRARVLSDDSGNPVRLLGMNIEITAQKKAEEALRQAMLELQRAHDQLEVRVQERTVELRRAEESLRALSGGLMQAQDEERRRIARELHDSAGQLLAALSMNLVPIRTRAVALDAEIVRGMDDSLAIVQELSSELRTISHLLHPPMLDEAGLNLALRWYVEGFAERSKIDVALDLAEDFGRLPRELETTIFRLIQESLTNIHRHSGSASAHIRIQQVDSTVTVAVQDFGKGMPPQLFDSNGPTRAGVGIRGMQERVRQLGGQLEITPGNPGTVVHAKLPIRQNASGSLWGGGLSQRSH